MKLRELFETYDSVLNTSVSDTDLAKMIVARWIIQNYLEKEVGIDFKSDIPEDKKKGVAEKMRERFPANALSALFVSSEKTDTINFAETIIDKEDAQEKTDTQLEFLRQLRKTPKAEKTLDDLRTSTLIFFEKLKTLLLSNDQDGKD